MPIFKKSDQIPANIIQCAKCKKILISSHVHDFVACGCGTFTDGGLEYLRRGGEVIPLQVFKARG